MLFPVLISLSKTVIILFAVFALSSVAFAASDDIPFRWEGKINTTQIIHGGEHGDVTTKWYLKPKMKETVRLNVKDAEGNLVGEFVKLDDCGSTWSSEVGGVVHIDQSNGYCEKVHSGSAGGSGAISSWGWIYYSLSDDDPLAELLPSGFYSLESASGKTQKYEKVITITDVNFDPPDTRISTINSPIMLHFKVNGAYHYQPFGPIDGPIPDGPFSVMGVEACLGSPVQAQMPRAWDKEMRIIEDEVMSGSCTTSWADGGITNMINWNISKRLDIDVVLEKAKEHWRPMVGEDAEPLQVTARIEEYTDLEGKWVFTLYDVSNEKGYCLNAGDSEDFDLEFAEGQSGFTEPEQTADGWKIETTETMNEATVTINSLDYGAWGRLKAEVFVEGQKYEAEVEGGGESITVPRDEDEDRIADWWERMWDISHEPADADNDSMPEGLTAEKGDGLSNYEEYRGFLVDGLWGSMATVPGVKDIFIRDRIGRGVGYFTTLGLKVHLIDENEFDPQTRVVNFNRGWGKLSQGQKGIIIREGILGESGTEGWVVTGETIGGPGPPKDIIEIIINPSVCSNYDVTVGHELGHAVNIEHHGHNDYDGTARRGGLWSGDISCIMRYDPPAEYYGAGGRGDGPYDYPYYEGPDSLTTFCDQQTGTEINAPGERTVDGKPYPVAANAAIGDCKKKVTLKGY